MSGEFLLLETDDDCIAYQYLDGKNSIIIVINLKNIEKNTELKVNGDFIKLYEYENNDETEISNGIMNINLLPLEIKIFSTSKF
jgi:hypothetical protein